MQFLNAAASLPLMLLVANLTKAKWCKIPENDWNNATWVLIWEYSERAIQWIPTWQGLDGFLCILVLWMKVASALEGSSMRTGELLTSVSSLQVNVCVWESLWQEWNSFCSSLPFCRSTPSASRTTARGQKVWRLNLALCYSPDLLRSVQTRDKTDRDVIQFLLAYSTDI